MIKSRSRILILSHIAQFSLGRECGGMEFAGLREMRFRENRTPAVGSLVAISSAPPSKHYLSWVHDVTLRDGFYEYGLESIEDGEIVNWSNVGIWEYDRTQTDRYPEWRWTDKQHEFSDKWRRACYKDRGAYMILPTGPTFGDGFSVTVGTRTRHGLNDFAPTKQFEDWRKVTKAMLLAFYDEAVELEKTAKFAA